MPGAPLEAAAPQRERGARRRLLPALAGLVWLGCAAPGPATPDPVAADPPVDAAAPARLDAVALESAGARMNGIVYVAGGAGPHPTALLLHGFPGHERNLDLAQALRRAGWNAVFFHYRGAWGSEGRFSFAHAIEDVAAAVRALRAPAFAERHRADPERIALVGHSMGGFAALVAGSELESVACVVSLAGADLGRLGRAATADAATARAIAARLDAWGAPLRSLGGETLVAELVAEAGRFDLVRRAPALARKPVLLVAGRRDEDTPLAEHHAPLARALREAGAARLAEVVLDADHAFSDHRVALARAVVGWLDATCLAPGPAQDAAAGGSSTPPAGGSSTPQAGGSSTPPAGGSSTPPAGRSLTR
jgi:pimeloyl-ACP methyl ester carboxylesterase